MRSRALSLTDRTRAYWSPEAEPASPPTIIKTVLLSTFVGNVDVVDHEAFGALAGQPCLYLANHQVAIESFTFVLAVSPLTRRHVQVLAKIEHRDSPMGQSDALFCRYPGMNDPHHAVPIYIDRDDPTQMAQIVSLLETRVNVDGVSLMVHVEGTRRRSARHGRVQRLSPVWPELALKNGWPIIPVRFVGGLPVEDLGVRHEVPFGYGAQTIRIGRPIAPSELTALPMEARATHVRDAINSLSVCEEEHPAPPDEALARAVAEWSDYSGADWFAATMMAALIRIRPGTEPQAGQSHTSEIIDGVVAAARLAWTRRGPVALVLPDTAEGRWMGEVAARLYGPRGPSVHFSAEAAAGFADVVRVGS
jgi:1-acyl-sn-glycerol-3-phosphate acyltransferase